ncbi:MAG: hypothetical protein Kow0090_04350 [Myxococcota bacterium]
MSEKGENINKKKLFLFYFVALLLFLFIIELLGRIAWRLAVEKVVLNPSAVDMSHLIMDDEHLGYLLKRNDCTHNIPYGRMDNTADWADTAPTWSLCTNSRGFRGDEFQSDKSPDTFRIVCMGDSHTMGESVEIEQTYCSRLKDYLVAKGCIPNKKIEAINAGVSGYSSFQGVIAYLKYVRDWRPDLVIVAYGSNDAMPLKHAFRTVRDRFIYKLPGEENIEEFYRFPKTGIAKVIFLAKRVLSSPPTDSGLMEGNRSTIEEFSENIAFLVNKIRADGAKVILLANIIKDNDYIIAEKEIAEREKIPIIETISLFKTAVGKIHSGEIYQKERAEIDSWLKPDKPASRDWMSKYVTNDNVHPNHVGHDIIAREITKVICGEKVWGKDK